jgi:hypothetical protein
LYALKQTSSRIGVTVDETLDITMAVAAAILNFSRLSANNNASNTRAAQIAQKSSALPTQTPSVCQRCLTVMTSSDSSAAVVCRGGVTFHRRCMTCRVCDVKLTSITCHVSQSSTRGIGEIYCGKHAPRITWYVETNKKQGELKEADNDVVNSHPIAPSPVPPPRKSTIERRHTTTTAFIKHTPPPQSSSTASVPSTETSSNKPGTADVKERLLVDSNNSSALGTITEDTGMKDRPSYNGVILRSVLKPRRTVRYPTLDDGDLNDRNTVQSRNNKENSEVQHDCNHQQHLKLQTQSLQHHQTQRLQQLQELQHSQQLQGLRHNQQQQQPHGFSHCQQKRPQFDVSNEVIIGRPSSSARATQSVVLTSPPIYLPEPASSDTSTPAATSGNSQITYRTSRLYPASLFKHASLTIRTDPKEQFIGESVTSLTRNNNNNDNNNNNNNKSSSNSIQLQEIMLSETLSNYAKEVNGFKDEEVIELSFSRQPSPQPQEDDIGQMKLQQQQTTITMAPTCSEQIAHSTDFASVSKMSNSIIHDFAVVDNDRNLLVSPATIQAEIPIEQPCSLPSSENSVTLTPTTSAEPSAIAVTLTLAADKPPAIVEPVTHEAATAITLTSASAADKPSSMAVTLTPAAERPSAVAVTLNSTAEKATATAVTLTPVDERNSVTAVTLTSTADKPSATAVTLTPAPLANYDLPDLWPQFTITTATVAVQSPDAIKAKDDSTKKRPMRSKSAIVSSQYDTTSLAAPLTPPPSMNYISNIMEQVVGSEKKQLFKQHAFYCNLLI